MDPNAANAYEKASQPADNILAQISEAALQVRAAEEKVKAANAALKTANEELRVLTEEVLPPLMIAAGQLECTTTDGLIVELKSDLSGSLPKGTTPGSSEKRSKAIKFILDHEPSILKSFITAELGKPRHMATAALQAAEDKRHAAFIDKVLDDLHEMGLDAQAKMDVNHMTLKAFAREMLSQGVAVPLDDLGLYAVKRVEVTQKEGLSPLPTPA